MAKESLLTSPRQETDGCRRVEMARWIGNGNGEDWAQKHAKELVNPTASYGYKLERETVNQTIANGSMTQAIQAYTLLSKASTRVPNAEDCRGGELLLRLIDEDDNIISPGYFFEHLTPAHHQAIGEHSLKTAARVARRIVSHGSRHAVISVNVHPAFLQSEDIATKITDAAKEARVEPSRLMLEFLEHMDAIDDNILAILRDVREQSGVRFAVDDMDPGDGFSPKLRGRNNVSGLLVEQLIEEEFHINAMKVAGSCVCGISTPKDELNRKGAVSNIMEIAERAGAKRIIFEGGPEGVTQNDIEVLQEIADRYNWPEENAWFEGPIASDATGNGKKRGSKSKRPR